MIKSWLKKLCHSQVLIDSEYIYKKQGAENILG